MRRTALRRRSQRDPVTPDVRASVMARDGECVLRKFDYDHVCRDRFLDTHRSDDLARMTLEHVKDDLAMGRRAPSDPAHLIVLCWAANLRPPTKEQRALFRLYLSVAA